MIARRIRGATNNLAAPRGWDPARDGPCHSLWVRVGREAVGPQGAVEATGRIVLESAWEPTPDELAALNAGGSIILRILAIAHPPVALYVEPQVEPGMRCLLCDAEGGLTKQAGGDTLGDGSWSGWLHCSHCNKSFLAKVTPDAAAADHRPAE